MAADPAELNRTLDASARLAPDGAGYPEAEVKFVDPLSEPGWDHLVLSHPDSHYFHSAAWAKVLWNTYGHKPFYVHICQRGEPIALIPLIEVASSFTGRRGVCLPSSDFCSPLLFHAIGVELVPATLCRLARQRKWKHFELRGGDWGQTQAIPARTFYGHELHLRAGSEALFARFRSSVRRAIRKSERSDFKVRVTWSREAIMDFYQLHVQTRRRHGLPPQPVSFFKNIHEHIIKPRLGFIVLAQHKSRSVAGSLFFKWRDKALYKFGASDKAFQGLRGNNLVMWEAIKFLAQGGTRTLHFGKTAVENEGLRRFKLSWGTQEKAIHYFRFDPWANSWFTPKWDLAGFHNHIFRRLPLALNRIAGAMIYPHLD